MALIEVEESLKYVAFAHYHIKYIVLRLRRHWWFSIPHSIFHQIRQIPWNLDHFVALRNAAQSSTWFRKKCAGNKCKADSAIDGDISTGSVTQGSSFEWWSAELTNVTRIERILINANMYAFESGFYGRFKVETRMKTSEHWKTCKGEYSITGSIKPHEVQCDKPTIAKYLRLSIAGGSNLYLNDVRVVGVPVEKGTTVYLYPLFVSTCYTDQRTN